MATQGQLIFCEVCKSLRASHVFVADVTTLNFNLLYEIGFALGLGIPIVPIRDTNLITDKADFENLGILGTLGYEDFRNVHDLVTLLPGKCGTATVLQDVPTRLFRESPVYLIRPPVMTDGSIQLESTLTRSRLRWRTYDPNEISRLTINEARRQVNGSFAVIAALLPTSREGHRVHNGLCAFVAGYATARQKIVILLQDGDGPPMPIDYRDIVQRFPLSTQIPRLLQPVLNNVYDVLQNERFAPVGREPDQLGLLRDLDLGDVAAENEVVGLQQYFLPTGPSLNAKRGHARLIVGRKGSGKSAIFYELRQSESRGLDNLVLDMKPEGHQFLRLREFVEDRMSAGLREYTLSAFWTYTLLSEIARKLLEADERVATRDPSRYEDYRLLLDVYQRHDPGEDDDFSQRLHRQVTRVVKQLEAIDPEEMGAKLTEIIFAGDVKILTDAVTSYIAKKRSVWLLIDNLDKGWPIRGSTDTDILLIRSLLEATRKLQHMIERRNVEFKCLVFLRTDIHDHLQESIPDKGKDTAIRVDWEDPVTFENLIARRVSSSTPLSGGFREDIWPVLSAPLVGTEDSFSYIVDRTLMRPRDLLLFLQRAVTTAINRGHNRISEDDILFSESGYSNELLANVGAEIVDTNPELDGILGAFQGSAVALDREEATGYIEMQLECDSARAYDTLKKLVWYGFFGVRASVFDAVEYSYAFPDFRRLTYPLDNNDAVVVVHPAFRSALNIQNL